MKFSVVCIILFFNGLIHPALESNRVYGHGQQDVTTQKATINQDPRLEQIVQKHIEKNQKQNGIKGYRIDIYSSSEINAKSKAMAQKAEFMTLYPDMGVYLKFNSPNFSVRVGDFRNKSEALKNLKKIQPGFPGAFIVEDQINFPSFNKFVNE